MKRLGWMAGAKALAATTALACVAIAASTAARADYSGTFTITSLSFSIGPASGTFTVSGIPTNSQSATVNPGNYTFTIGGNTHTGSGGSTNTFSNAAFSFGPSSGSNNSIFFTTIDNYSYTATTISGTVLIGETVGSNRNQGEGLFSAALSPVPSGGGGGSGGAPTPEVNAGLGILIAGASFAFLRRKRGGRHEATAA